jgi:hypothetical protein
MHLNALAILISRVLSCSVTRTNAVHHFEAEGVLTCRKLRRIAFERAQNRETACYSGHLPNDV